MPPTSCSIPQTLIAETEAALEGPLNEVLMMAGSHERTACELTALVAASLLKNSGSRMEYLLECLANPEIEQLQRAAQHMDRSKLRQCRANLAIVKGILDELHESATPEQLRFPPGRPDIELYSQMLEVNGDNRVDTFEFGAHAYINGKKLQPYHHSPSGMGIRPEAPPCGFRVIQFDRSWSVLSDDVWELYHDYDKGGDNSIAMRDRIASFEAGNPVAVITGDASGPCDGSPFVAEVLRDGMKMLGASVFPAEFNVSNKRAKKPALHETVMRFAYAALLIRGAPPETEGLFESFQDHSTIGCHAHLVLAVPAAAAHARLNAFRSLAQAQLPPQEPVPEGLHEGIRCVTSGMMPIIGNRYELPGKKPWHNLCEAEFLKLPAKEQVLYLKFEPTQFSRRRKFLPGDQTAIDIGRLQREIASAREAGLPEALLASATRAMEGEQQRRTRTAMEINIRAVAGEGAPADLLAYLKSLHGWIERAKPIQADVGAITQRLKQEQPGAEAMLAKSLEVDAASSDGIPDLVALEHSISVASLAGVSDAAIKAATEALTAHRKRREMQRELEEELLQFQKYDHAPGTIDFAQAMELVRRAKDAGVSSTLLQAVEQTIQKLQSMEATDELSTLLKRVCAELSMDGTKDSIDQPGPGGRGSEDETRYMTETLVFGQPVDAARGLTYYCHVSDDELSRAKARGIDAIRDEFRAQTHERADDDNECLTYILDQEAGASDKAFQNGLKRDCDHQGNVLASRQVDDGNGGRRGMRLADFQRTVNATIAGLTLAEVASVRLYSTAAFRSINLPLRDLERHLAGKPHPLPVTVSFLQDAVKKLRSVDAVSDVRNEEIFLWRGMANRSCSDEFFRDGGTELAPMSTTTDLRTAVQYSASTESVLLRLRTSSFMDRGADISFLSAFEGESEMLFPPLTYLRVNEQHKVAVASGLSFTVIDVTPMMS